MNKYFYGIGEVVFQKLTTDRINEAANLIYNTYQSEKIWLSYSKEQVIDELMSSFTNLVYRPNFFIALQNNMMIGIASYMWSHTSSCVLELSFGTVHPDFQRKGIGQHLTYLRLREIIEKSSEDSVVITVSRRPKLFEKFNFTTSFMVKNEKEDSSFMFCKVVDLPDYKSIKLIANE